MMLSLLSRDLPSKVPGHCHRPRHSARQSCGCEHCPPITDGQKRREHLLLIDASLEVNHAAEKNLLDIYSHLFGLRGKKR